MSGVPDEDDPALDPGPLCDLLYGSEVKAGGGVELLEDPVDGIRELGEEGSQAIQVAARGVDRLGRIDIGVAVDTSSSDRDHEERFPASLLDEMVTEGLVTLERVEIIAYRAPETE